ncbi:MAG: DNA topoisomerase IB [Pseudomonadota bacterium]
MQSASHRDLAEEMGLTIVPVDDLTIERVINDSDGTFEFVAAKGTLSKKRRKQIEKLVIPPAWSHVRIADFANSHIQAVGRDQKGRLQYLYHERWEEVREAVKARRLRVFGQALPRIRKTVERDLKRPLTSRRGVIATVVRLIDRQLIRIGNEQYVRDGTYWASTLENSHVKIRQGRVRLSYTAKSGKQVDLELKDPALVRRIKKLRNMRGKRLFQIRKKSKRGRSSINLRASHINAYLTKAAGTAVSAKDFRSFAASALAVAQLSESEDASVAQAAKTVSKRLRNTPAVARNSYIHPSIISAAQKSQLDEGLTKGRKRKGLDVCENALMRFLEKA